MLIESQSYCSIFKESESGVSGYFTINIDEAAGLSYYDFNVDLSSFSTTCDTSNGLKYHIHSFWTNNAATSSNSCGSCGNHFDPYLSCSSTSQYQISPATYPGPLCKSLNRFSPNYTYPCSSTSFSNGNLQGCEVGDLSGKFGIVKNSSTSPLIFKSSTVLSDPLGPTSYTYGNGSTSGFQQITEYTSVWNSIVFHCNNAPNNTRLFCGQLLTSNVDSCVALGATLTPSLSDNNNKSSNCWFDIGISVVITFVVFLTVLLIMKYSYRKHRDNDTDKGMSDPLILNH